MILKLSFLFIFLEIFTHSVAQKNFSLTVNIDTTINPKDLIINVNNGETVLYPKAFKNGQSSIYGKFYSRCVNVTMVYQKKGAEASRRYWISTDPAIITLKGNPTGNLFDAAITQNMQDIFKIHKKEKDALDSFTKKESDYMSSIWENKAQYKSQVIFDSIQKTAFIALLNKSSRYMSAHNNNYFYFWYFKDQFYETAKMIYRKDTALRLAIADSLLKIFSKKLVSGYEGQKVKEEESRFLHPLVVVGRPAPKFQISDIHNEVFNIDDYKGKMVLLDFWASWCPPCLKQIPVLRKIRRMFSIDSLIVVGVSIDNDYKQALQAISEKNMNWKQLYDKNGVLSRIFSIDAIPVTVLIDQQGKIIYKSIGSDDLENKVVNLLNKYLGPVEGAFKVKTL